MKLIDFLQKMGTPVNAPTTFEILDVKNKKLAKYQGILVKQRRKPPYFKAGI